MKQLILVIAFLGGSGILNAQMVWTKAYSGEKEDSREPRAMVTDGAGNVYVTGEGDIIAHRGMTTVKFGPNGDILWAKTYPGNTQTLYKGYSIAIDSAGNIIALGTNGANTKVFLKYSPSGTLLWAKSYAITATNNPQNIGIDSQNNIFYTSTLSRTTPYSYSALILTKYDSNGDSLWTKEYNGVSDSITITSPPSLKIHNNEIFIYSVLRQINQSTKREGLLVRYDLSGNLIYSKRLKKDTSHVHFGSLEIDAGGNAYVSGTFYSEFLNSHGLLVKFNNAGDTVWTKDILFGYPTLQEDMGIDHNGHIYVTGSVKDSTKQEYVIYTAKYDVSGNYLWHKIYFLSPSPFGEDFGRKITVDRNGNANVAGVNIEDLRQYVLYLQYSPQGDLAANYRQNFGGGFCFYDIVLDIHNDNNGRVFLLSKNDKDVVCSWEWRLTLYNNIPTNITQVSGNAPDKFRLYNNYPNPFNPTSTIRFDIPYGTHVKLKVYDMLGKEIAELVNQNLDAGTYQYNWDGGSNASGMYLYRLETDSYTEVRKMMLVK